MEKHDLSVSSGESSPLSRPERRFPPGSMEKLTSSKNPRVQSIRSLSDRRGRLSQGAFLAEGDKMVREALESSFPVREILLREDRPLPDWVPPGLPVLLFPEGLFNSLSDTRTPQGISAVVESRPRPAEGRLLLALDAVQDPGNVGTIIRTADAAGFQGILLGPGCADVFSPKVLRATMGSVFRMGLSFPDNLGTALSLLKERGYSILSSQLDGEPFFSRSGVADSLVLIIGNEGNGVSPEVQKTATHRLRLPMRGGAESLNAAVAAAIMMYDITRGRLE